MKYAQQHFAETCGRGGYAASLPQLRIVLTDFSDGFLNAAFQYLPDPVGGMSVRLLPADAAQPGPLDCMDRPTTRAYYASATYKWSYWKGPAFAMATDGVIWQSATPNPPREPFGAPATPVR